MTPAAVLGVAADVAVDYDGRAEAGAGDAYGDPVCHFCGKILGLCSRARCRADFDQARRADVASAATAATAVIAGVGEES